MVQVVQLFLVLWLGVVSSSASGRWPVLVIGVYGVVYGTIVVLYVVVLRCVWCGGLVACVYMVMLVMDYWHGGTDSDVYAQFGSVFVCSAQGCRGR